MYFLKYIIGTGKQIYTLIISTVKIRMKHLYENDVAIFSSFVAK